MIDEEDNIDEEILEGEQPEETGPSEIEKEAALMGHIPKEEFRGNPDDWIDAETFVRRGREVMPILRKNNERLLTKVQELEKARVEDRRTFEEFRKFQESALERQKADALAQLRAARKEAISTADGDAFERFDEQIKQVEAYQPPEVLRAREPEVPTPPPELVEWIERNTWYQNDPELQALADGIGKKLRQSGYDRPFPDFLEEVGKRVKAAMPDSFQNPARRQPAAVDAPAPRARRTNGRSYDDLPKEAKELCDRFVNSGTIRGYTRDMYVRDYQWS